MNPSVLNMIDDAVVEVNTVDGKQHRGTVSRIAGGEDWLALKDESRMDDVPTVLIPLPSIASIETVC